MVGGISQRDDRTYVRVDQIEAAMAVLDLQGVLVDATPAAFGLLDRFGLSVSRATPLPTALADQLRHLPLGAAMMWSSPHVDGVLGCTRYRIGEHHLLLLLREITEQQRALSRRLHQQRLESTGRLVAHIAHDLRAPLASIVYNLDVLAQRMLDSPGESAELVRETQLAADQLRRTIAGLLDFVRVGPPVTETLSLRATVERVSSLLRSVFRAGGHELAIEFHDDVSVCGNPIAIEQIIVNLLVNATESAGGDPVKVRLSTNPVAPRADKPWRALDRMVCIRVSDNGPGIPAELRHAVFEPFVTSKPEGTGLGLTLALEAATSLGGHLELEVATCGTSFALILPVVGDAANTESVT